MLLYDVYYEGSRFGGFDAARPLPTEGMDVGDVAVCVNGPKQTLVWDGEEWLDEELDKVDYDTLQIDVAMGMLQEVRGGWTVDRVNALLADATKRGLPLSAYSIEVCADEKSGRRYGERKTRRGWAVKLGGGGRNRGETGYQVWAVVRKEYRGNN